MRFFETILSGAALLAAVVALEINQFPQDGVVAGQSYTITYSPADDTPTTFILRQGQSTDLDTIGTLTTEATGGSFTWTPSTSLPNEEDYALEIRQGDVVNYSAQFPLTGGSDEPAEVSSAVSSAVASASSVASSISASVSSATASAASSLSSELVELSTVLSSIQSSVIVTTMTSHASASATISPSAGFNSTISNATLSRSGFPTGSATTTSSLPEVSEAAGNALIGSPLAAMFGAAAAFAYLA